MLKTFPFYKQLDQMDCGPTCLKMISAYYGNNYSLQYLREKTFFSRSGVSLKGIIDAAQNIGLRTMPVKIYFNQNEVKKASLLEAPLPCIVHWNQRHFVVVYKYSKKYVWIADPANGKHKIDHQSFQKNWLSDGQKGIALLLDTTPDFFQHVGQKINKQGFGFLFKYLHPYKKLLFQLSIGLILASLFQLIVPFLTQSIVDIGIENQNIPFIWLILIAQLMVFVGQTTVNVLQSWILLHVSTRINVSLLSDFLIKLMKLPIGFFDAKMVGDLLQRIGDHNRIEAFLTGSTLSVIFSIVNLFVFGGVLLVYNFSIFLTFVIASVFYVSWIFIFLKKRKEVDYQRFGELSQNQDALIELIQGMQEIKLQNSEHKRRRLWTNIQARLFHVNIRSLAITQYQDTGATSINQLKDIFISFMAAQAVIEGQMTLGMMLAIQYIIGQLNAPLQKMISFIRSAQDAKISMERLGEIHDKEEETNHGQQLDVIPPQAYIHFENLSFRYNELETDVLKNINLSIPEGKVTAIVGVSGSGKTSLVKLLLGFYEAQQGSIRIGGIDLRNIRKQLWRERCGAVMQDGYIFSDTIANNIAESDETVDQEKLFKAAKMACIQTFIESLPLGYNTMVGARGKGISQGQRQRLLIARAIYKNPDFLFFDEATNALDAKNERAIIENLKAFFSGRTVVVVAHRLSTVKNADQIVVLEKGAIKEIGQHHELVARKGIYYGLVKDQLELGN